MSPPRGRTVVLLGEVLTEAQSRALLRSLARKLTSELANYATDAGTERARGFNDAIGLIEQLVDAHTESIGDGAPPVASP